VPISLAAASGYLAYSRATWLSMVVARRKRLHNGILIFLAYRTLLMALFMAPGSSHGER
jgi:hypothetical protein